MCEQRDTKGLYKRARAGEVKGFTGIDDPYEAPRHPEVRLDTVQHTAEENARQIVDYLADCGFVRTDTPHLPNGRQLEAEQGQEPIAAHGVK